MSGSSFAVLVPVGPGEEESARLDDTVDSLLAYEPTARLFVIDDNEQDRNFAARLPSDATVIRTPLWGRGVPPSRYDAIMLGTITALREVQRAPVDWMLSIDTDAIVAGKFAASIEAALSAHPRAGLLGSAHRLCTGEPRVTGQWRLDLLMSALPVQTVLSGGRRTFSTKHPAAAWRCAALLRAARRNGYEWGEHCLGGAYVVTRSLLDRLDLIDPTPWKGGRLPEDVVLGVLCRAAGLDIVDLVDRGEPFGVRHIGLPASPEWLLARGHVLLHSVKDEPGRREADTRAWFRQRRGTGATAERATRAEP
ncbi:MAG: glycosyltransferase family 2 protein [Acidimicrobiales bacterium]|nr:glycosyltransferase family 2 protein [Acidimicrobiales bacterium]